MQKYSSNLLLSNEIQAHKVRSASKKQPIGWSKIYFIKLFYNY